MKSLLTSLDFQYGLACRASTTFQTAVGLPEHFLLPVLQNSVNSFSLLSNPQIVIRISGEYAVEICALTRQLLPQNTSASAQDLEQQTHPLSIQTHHIFKSLNTQNNVLSNIAIHFVNRF